MPQYKFCFARFPGGGVESADCADWVTQTRLKMAVDPHISEVIRFKMADTPISMSRNRAVRTALQHGCDYLLMVDNDVHPDDDLGEDPGAKPFWDSTWAWLMEHRDVPCAVAAPYVGPPPFENVYMFQWATKQGDDPNPHWSLEQFTREEAAIRSGFQEVAAAPTGLIIYDMRVFERMKPVKDKGWFYYEWTDATCSEKASTEDVTQTRDMGLAYYGTEGRAGGIVWCNWDAWCGHDKKKRCRRPRIIRTDSVADGYKQAVLRGIDSDDHLVETGSGRIPFPPVRRRTSIPKHEFFEATINGPATSGQEVAP